MRRIAYIPARSGSKGIPKKNIKELCGRPLLGWVVKAALDSGLFDRVMVSTDSEEFAEVARKCGAWVPFLRDPEVAKDTTSSIETVCSDKRRLEEIGEVFDTFCLIQPTAPLCRAVDIIEAVKMFESKATDGVVSVVRTSIRPTLLRKVGEDGKCETIISNTQVLRRQDEGSICMVNGALYINRWIDVNLDLKLAYNPYAYIMDEISSIDIDNIEDFAIAEKHLKARLIEGGKL